MFCDECGKNVATTHYTKIINGKKSEIHLCESCAKNLSEYNFESPFSVHQLLTGLLDNITDGTKKLDYINNLRCKSCGMAYMTFKQSSKFGCDECYISFKKQLYPLFKRIHGSDAHTGKIPKNAGSEFKFKREIEKLKAQLNITVENEEYEKAVILRDKIREIEKELNS